MSAIIGIAAGIGLIFAGLGLLLLLGWIVDGCQ